MFLDNLLPSFIGAVAAPIAKMKSKGAISGIDSIWDVGANHGQFAFMAHNVWPDLPIYSFEPDPSSVEKLQNL
jgi:precorrin-6B methylase 2